MEARASRKMNVHAKILIFFIFPPQERIKLPGTQGLQTGYQ
jgi:hypothetical protein